MTKIERSLDRALKLLEKELEIYRVAELKVSVRLKDQKHSISLEKKFTTG